MIKNIALLTALLIPVWVYAGVEPISGSASIDGAAVAPASIATTGDVTIGTGTAVPSTRLTVVNSGAGIIVGINTAASGTGSGAGISGFTSNLPAAQGHRIGFYTLGYFNGANSRNSVAIQGFADEAWTDGSAQGSYMRLETTPIGSASRREVVRITSGGGMRPFVRTKAQFDAITPSDPGEIYICSDCTVTYSVCTATGTTLSGFRRADSATAGCGTGE